MSAETEAKEWSALESRILLGLGHLRISEITDVSVEDFSAELLRKGLSNSTVNSRLRIARKVLAHARRRGTGRNPVSSCLAKDDHRVYFRRAPGRKVAG